MKLKYPALPLSVPMESINEIVLSTVKKKNWASFETKNVRLRYLPVWIFVYEVSPENVPVGEDIGGQIAIDATTGSLLEYLPAAMEEIPAELSKETKHEYSCTVDDPVVLREEAGELAKMKLASRLGVGEDKVKVAGGKLIYLPVWEVWISIGNEEYKLKIDGFTGVPSGDETIPERKKTTLELVQETLSEMRDPRKVIHYFLELPTAWKLVFLFTIAALVVLVIK